MVSWHQINVGGKTWSSIPKGKPRRQEHNKFGAAWEKGLDIGITSLKRVGTRPFVEGRGARLGGRSMGSKVLTLWAKI